MPKPGTRLREAPKFDLQAKIDKSDVIGIWDWDIAGDHVFADPLVAMLFNVDPMLAAAGLPLTSFTDSIHPEDRAITTQIIGRTATTGGSYVAEYRVCSADRITRWILARGRFELDHAGHPSRGRGILIDITRTRISKDAYVAVTSAPSNHPLERIADHCLAVREAAEELQDSLVRQLADMLLLEVGRGLAKLETVERRRGMN